MSEATKIQARFEEFASGFLDPLLTGGHAVAGQALTPGMLDHFALAKTGDIDVDQRIYDQLHEGASEIAQLRALEWPSRGLAAVSMVAHNLVALTDPKLDRAFARGAIEKILAYDEWLIDAAGAPETRGEALARHAIMTRFLGLSREDVVIKNWAYTYRFFGRPIPPRVVAMPRVRLVRQNKTGVDLIELLRGLDDKVPVMAQLRRLVSRSPVTQLLRTDLFGVPDMGTAALAVLSDDLVRNGIARELVIEGASVMAPIGAALFALDAARPPPRMMYYLIALIFEAHVIAILDARAAAAPVFAHPSGDTAKLFAAILPAVLGAPDDLGALLELDPDDLLALRRRAGALDAAAGPEASARAVDLVDYAEPPQLDHERSQIPSSQVNPGTHAPEVQP